MGDDLDPEAFKDPDPGPPPRPPTFQELHPDFTRWRRKPLRHTKPFIERRKPKPPVEKP